MEGTERFEYKEVHGVPRRTRASAWTDPLKDTPHMTTSFVPWVMRIYKRNFPLYNASNDTMSRLYHLTCRVLEPYKSKNTHSKLREENGSSYRLVEIVPSSGDSAPLTLYGR